MPPKKWYPMSRCFFLTIILSQISDLLKALHKKSLA